MLYIATQIDRCMHILQNSNKIAETCDNFPNVNVLFLTI